MEINEVIKQFNTNVINLQVANELFDPLQELSKKQLSEILKFISIKKLKQVVENNNIEVVYDAILYSGEISSLRCLKYVMNEYNFYHQLNDKVISNVTDCSSNKFASDILYFFLKNDKKKYVDFILKKYSENIDYKYLLRLFSEERDGKCIAFILRKFGNRLSDEDYTEFTIYNKPQKVKEEVSKPQIKFPIFIYLLFQIVMPILILIKLFYL